MIRHTDVPRPGLPAPGDGTSRAKACPLNLGPGQDRREDHSRVVDDRIDDAAVIGPRRPRLPALLGNDGAMCSHWA